MLWAVNFQSIRIPVDEIINNSREVIGILKTAAEERGDSLGTCFSLTHGSAFSLFSATIFRKLEDDDEAEAEFPTEE